MKSIRVLLIEDDQWLGEQFARTLEAVGCAVDISPNTIDAISRIDIHLPDVIILDVFLPGPNAFVFLHELRSYADLAKVPVVLCTNSDGLAEEDLATYGITRLLRKSEMLPKDLVAAVRKAAL